MSLRFVLGQLWAGKTIARAYQNLCIRGRVLRGDIVDLGARDANSSYHRLMRFEGTVVHTDLIPRDPKVVKMDLEEPFPFGDNSFDHAMLFNVLELIWNHEQCMAETCRVLRPGGSVIGCAPLVVREHHDPVDYYRYTIGAMRRLLEQTGFENIRVERICVGPFKSAFFLVQAFIRPRPLVFLAGLLAIGADAIVCRVSKAHDDFYCFVQFEADKPR